VIWLRAAVFQIAFYLWTVLMAPIGLPLLLAPPLWMMRYGTFWSAGTLWLLRCCVGLTHEIHGRERLPKGPILIAMKHQSAWDTLAAPIIFRNPAVVIKRELGWLPFYGWYALKAGMIPVDRAGGARALKRMVKASEKALAQGRPILIFPEGTRSAIGAPAAYQPGIVALYRQLDIPLVPVAVNSGLFWGRRHFLKRSGRIIVEILPPIPPGHDRRKVMDELEAQIEGATARLVGAAALDKPVESARVS